MTARAQVDGRHRAEGRAGLFDRSSAPKVVANRVDERGVEVIAALRRLRMTGAEIAERSDGALDRLGDPDRIGMGKLGRLGLEPAQRYERARPGELIHIDVKKLGRIERCGTSSHRQARDTTSPTRPRRRPPQECRLGVRPHRDRDATRLAYVEVLPMRRPSPPSGSSAAPSSTTRPQHHRRTLITETAPPNIPRSTPSPAAPSGSAISAPVLTGPRPTAKPNASSAPCSPAGPTARSTAQAPNATPRILSTRPPRPARPLNGTVATVAPRASSSCQTDSSDTSSRCAGRSRA